MPHALACTDGGMRCCGSTIVGRPTQLTLTFRPTMPLREETLLWLVLPSFSSSRSSFTLSSTPAGVFQVIRPTARGAMCGLDMAFGATRTPHGANRHAPSPSQSSARYPFVSRVRCTIPGADIDDPSARSLPTRSLPSGSPMVLSKFLPVNYDVCRCVSYSMSDVHMTHAMICPHA